MLEVIQMGFSLIILCVFGWVVWQSVLMVDEKKQRQRKGISDYYDNPIDKQKKL